MKYLGLLLVMAFCAANSRAAILAGPITNPANGHSYYLLDADTWTTSEALAVLLGGHLVTVNDADENAWLVDTFSTYGGIQRPLWIGLTDRDAEGAFTWVGGGSSTYLNWNTATGEPNNSGGSGYEEDYAYIVEPSSGNPTLLGGFWNDAPDSGFGVQGGRVYGVVEVRRNLGPSVTASRGLACFETVAGIQYQVQSKPRVSRGKWVNFGEPVTGTGEEVCVSGPPHPVRNRVYRVVILQ